MTDMCSELQLRAFLQSLPSRQERAQLQFGAHIGHGVLPFDPHPAPNTEQFPTGPSTVHRIDPEATARLELPSPRSCFPAPMHLELLENVVDVILHGRHLNAQATRDILVRQTLSEYP